MKVISMILLVCLLGGVFSKPVEILISDVGLEDMEPIPAVLGNGRWLDKSAFNNNMNDAMNDLRDNISRLQAVVKMSNNNNMYANNPSNNNYQYPLPNYPPQSSYSKQGNIIVQR